jgi:hypothetical protein
MQHKADRYISLARWRLKGVTVSALIGRSGSGKGFRARLIAERRGFDLIIDDGLVIHGDTILAGHWAKKERLFMAAVRRALFADAAAAREAREALQSVPFRSALITATSRRMAERISSNLWLPSPRDVISIEELATVQEIEQAMRRRERRDAHSSPVPMVRIRRGPVASLRALLRGVGSLVPVAARIETPSSAAPGTVAFSEAAMTQMAVHCVHEFNPRIAVTRVSFLEGVGMAALELWLRIPASDGESGSLHRLRDAVMHGMERSTGIIVGDVRVVVEEVASAPAAAQADGEA